MAGFPKEAPVTRQDPDLAAWLALPVDRRKTMMQASDFANDVALSRVGSGSKHNAEYQRIMNLIRDHVSCSQT